MPAGTGVWLHLLKIIEEITSGLCWSFWDDCAFLRILQCSVLDVGLDECLLLGRLEALLLLAL